ncbi:MAG: histidine kinase dimerization/phosphoacceptor domain -containing protein [Salibacteraceae bacterium]
MVKAPLLVILILLATVVSAQPPYRLYSKADRDSCLNRLEQLPNGPEKLYLLQELSLNFNRNNPELSMRLARESQLLATELGSTIQLSEAHRLMGLVYQHSGNFSEALIQMLKSMEVSQALEKVEQQALAKYTIARLFHYLDRQEERKSYFKEAQKLAYQSGGNFIIARMKTYEAGLIQSSQNVEASLPLYEEALHLYRLEKLDRYVALTLTSQGKVFSKLNQFDKAFENFRMARNINQKIDNPSGMGYSDLTMANQRIVAQQLDSVPFFHQRALDTFRESENIRGMAHTLIGKCRYYMAIGNTEAATASAEACSSYIERWPTDRQTQRIYRFLSRLFGEAGLHEQAYQYSLKHIAAREKLIGDEIGKQVAAVERKLIYQAKNEEIILAEQAKQEAEIVAQKERKEKKQSLWFSAFFLLLILVVAYAYFRIRRVNALLAEKNQIIEKDLEVRGNLLRELHHRVKNNLQIVDSFFGMQERKVDAPQAREVIREGRNRLRSMTLLHSELYHEDNPTSIQLHQYLANLGSHLKKTFLEHRPEIQLNMQLNPMEKDADFAINIGLIVNELLTNAIKYAFPNGQAGHISVALKSDANGLLLIVKDDGIGISGDPLKVHTSGLMLVRNFSRKIGGELRIKNQNGTEIQVRIPIE